MKIHVLSATALFDARDECSWRLDPAMIQPPLSLKMTWMKGAGERVAMWTADPVKGPGEQLLHCSSTARCSGVAADSCVECNCCQWRESLFKREANHAHGGLAIATDKYRYSSASVPRSKTTAILPFGSSAMSLYETRPLYISPHGKICQLAPPSSLSAIVKFRR